MDILSKGGFSVPVILAILEYVSIMHVAHGATQTAKLDIIDAAASSLSSVFSSETIHTPHKTAPRSSHQSQTIRSAGNALGQAVEPKYSSSSSQSAQAAKQSIQKTTTTPAANTSGANQAGQTNPPGIDVTQRLQPNPVFPRLLSPVFVPQTVSSAKKVTGYIEIGATNEHVTNNEGNWNDQYILGVFQTDDKNTWNINLNHDNRFYDTADYGQISNTYIINDNWYSSLGVGASDTSNIVPKYYVGGRLFQKQGPRKQIIGYMGFDAYWWRGTVFGQPGITLDINPGLIYYFEKPYVIEGGAYINRGKPGAVYSASGYVALTEGKNKDHYYAVRLGFGREAYLPTGIGFISPPTVAYPSYTIGVTWRQWIGKNWGFNLVGDYYHNDFYQRYGASTGLFWEFGE